MSERKPHTTPHTTSHTTPHTTRRQVALGGLMGLGGVVAGCAAEPEAVVEPSVADRIASAEPLLGVEFTDAEREQMAQGLEASRAGLKALRDFDKPNALSPAVVFDPRLPGVDYVRGREDRFYAPNRKRGSGMRADATDTDIAFASVETLGRMLEDGRITSVALTRLYLDRIARYGDALECFVTVTPELAMDQAREADARRARGESGPLLGMPYAAKDLFDTDGIRTTYGATPFRDRVATDNAWVIARLNAAGAVLLGKTTLGALAYGDQWFGGTTRNPWNAEEGSSGSSAGSAAAVAAGLCAFALGTETLGSLVSPSTRCGTTSLRPTFGQVPRTGAMALCWSMDKIGPMVRSAGDVDRIMPTLVGTDAGDPGSLGEAYGGATMPARVGFDPAWFAGANAAQTAALAAVRAMEGVELVEVGDVLPDVPLGALSNILLAEAAAAFEMLSLDGRDDDLVWQDDAAWPNTFRAARFITAIDLVQSQRIRRLAMEHMHGVFDRVDALISPPFAGGLLQVTNYTGHPCTVQRVGFIESGTRTLFGDAGEDGPKTRVPTSLCLWGGLFRDGDLVQLAMRLEKGLGVAGERPPGFA